MGPNFKVLTQVNVLKNLLLQPLTGYWKCPSRVRFVIRPEQNNYSLQLLRSYIRFMLTLFSVMTGNLEPKSEDEFSYSNRWTPPSVILFVKINFSKRLYSSKSKARIWPVLEDVLFNPSRSVAMCCRHIGTHKTREGLRRQNNEVKQLPGTARFSQWRSCRVLQTIVGDELARKDTSSGHSCMQGVHSFCLKGLI